MESIESVSKVGALALLLVYGLGYLVVSVYFASMGMVLANPFKPRIIAAGLEFVVLAGIPIWVYEKTVNAIPLSLGTLSDRLVFRLFFSLVHFYFICSGLALMFLVFFPVTVWYWKSMLVILALAFLHACFVATRGTSQAFADFCHHWWGIPTAVYAAAIVVLVRISFNGWSSNSLTFFDVVAWVYGIGVFFNPIRPRPNTARGLSASHLLFACVPILVFADWVYPNTKAEWGGGQPVPIIIRFTKDSALWPSQKGKYRLVDEADSGFYILPDSGKHPVFVPRTSVGAVAYSADLHDLP